VDTCSRDDNFVADEGYSREFIWFGTYASLTKIPSQYLELTDAVTTVHSSSFVFDLGVILDSELQMKRHVNKMRTPAASSTAVPTPWLYQEERYVTPCDITHTDTHRQL